MGCSTNTTVGPKIYAGTATTSCKWKFTCENYFILDPGGNTMTVTCYGTKVGKPWSQITTTVTTCCDENSPCAGGNNCSTSTSTVTTYGIDWDTCDIGGRNCCPDGTIVTAPFYQPT